MAKQITNIAKKYITIPALHWSLSGVSPHMSNRLQLLPEPFLTLAAPKWLLPCAYLHMIFKWSQYFPIT